MTTVSPASVSTALTWLADRKPQSRQALLDLMAIRSVSNAPGFDSELARAAERVRTMLESAGVESVIPVKVGAHVPPLILGADDSAGSQAPLVVFYAHYDVQPAGEGWKKTEAFTPRIIDDRFIGRGAGDDKGPLVAIVQALAAWKQGTGGFPVRLRIIFEGQEESGSGAIIEYLQSDDAREFLSGASTVVICDTLMAPDGRPSLTFGLRGLTYFTLNVFGPEKAAHSGHVGGAVQDPGEALAHLLASLRDPQTGRLLVAGINDDIAPLNDRERELLSSSPVGEASVQKETGGVPGLMRVDGKSIAEQTGALPSLTVHSLLMGDTQVGSAPTNIPTTAAAKFSIRLVPNMTPDNVERLVSAHIERATREVLGGTVRVELKREKGSEAVRFSPESAQLDAAARAMLSAWGTDPCYMLAGGSIPVVSHFERLLKAPIVMWGGTNADSNFHGPDENLEVPAFHSSSEGLVHLLNNLATV